ncbi:ADP-ribosylglycohydrolase family protein [Lacihabitans sp. LS3-19]|uniref:ADP-ribosylglycohydrolase family protein n=1 Tax=Lacihabitans sp. LS3-19 TaxID=2487335 RepID=UPI0020CC398B|nr:ADP-ribosylglycohydrolase family protein [Lacihabitans sp. LS3-19]MCP9768554.1 ADP-ribosylglycohydrolase family protein [Lacihabitans sp. LS3-19]
MKVFKVVFLILILGNISFAQQKTITFTKTQLKDKIMGGWAGQTIGVTFGGPMEFRYNGTIINEYQPVPWYDGYLKKTMLNNPGLYDDLYMDLTFVDVFEKEGLDAPVSSHANAFANAGYALWHANQAARYNILHGISAPESGQWKNNPHADCIDYQIECDFAGLMSPGMPNTASAISDKIGHIMNSGDGYYGGVFLGACYTLAFTSTDIKYIINEALKTIPKESNYYKCIADVIVLHKANPTDWKKTWYALQDKWAQDIGCPDGVFAPFNIDATLNSAYVVLGLLYGNGDYTQTMEITTRCGQDADCNPSSAGGILGTVLGYSNIPDYWKMGLKEAEDIDFKYTTISLNKVYDIGFKHALQNIERNGGKINGDKITIALQKPETVKMEKSFEGVYPVDKVYANVNLKDEYSFDFEGTGFVVKGEMAKWASESQYVFEVEVYLDDKLIEKALLPTSFKDRRHEIAWKYDIPKGKHQVKLKILNPSQTLDCRVSEVLVYSDQANDFTNQTIYRFGPKKFFPKKN